MASSDDFNIAHARQTYRAIRLVRMPALPSYATYVDVACRVGRAISLHAAKMPWNAAIELNTAQAIRYADPHNAFGRPALQQQSRPPPRKYPPSDSEKFFAQALTAYRFAADATETVDIERHAEMARTYLDRAHQAAALVETRRAHHDGNSND